MLKMKSCVEEMYYLIHLKVIKITLLFLACVVMSVKITVLVKLAQEMTHHSIFSETLLTYFALTLVYYYFLMQ